VYIRSVKSGNGIIVEGVTAGNAKLSDACRIILKSLYIFAELPLCINHYRLFTEHLISERSGKLNVTVPAEELVSASYRSR